MISVMVRDKYLETLNALGDIQSAVDAALERYTIEQILSKINSLRSRQAEYQSKHGMDYETFAKRVEQDETFVRTLEVQGNKMWEADLLDWEFCAKGIEDWKRRLWVEIGFDNSADPGAIRLKYGKVGTERAGELVPHAHRKDKSEILLTEEITFELFVEWLKLNLAK